MVERICSQQCGGLRTPALHNALCHGTPKTGSSTTASTAVLRPEARVRHLSDEEGDVGEGAGARHEGPGLGADHKHQGLAGDGHLHSHRGAVGAGTNEPSLNVTACSHKSEWTGRPGCQSYVSWWMHAAGAFNSQRQLEPERGMKVKTAPWSWKGEGRQGVTWRYMRERSMDSRIHFCSVTHWVRMVGFSCPGPPKE